MTNPPPRLMLITPALGPDAADAGWPGKIAAACRAGDVAAVVLRIVQGDERAVINTIKAVAPAVQAVDVALVAQAAPSEAVRGGADGCQVDGAENIRTARKALPEGRSLGAAQLRSRDDAMDAGEAGADYVLFGEPRADGSLPTLAAIIDRATWWTEVFQTPCVVHAASAEMVAPLVATGAEFIALGEWALLGDDPAETVRRCAAEIAAIMQSDAALAGQPA
jgi:thiamine-phosphate pyrophosphorylase